MARPEIVVVIPESTRKVKGGSSSAIAIDAVSDALPSASQAKLQGLRDEVLKNCPAGSVSPAGVLPAFRRFDGNMYRHIPADAWEGRAPNVEVLIVSALRGLLASRDSIPAYSLSMAEPTPPFGKMNRWWHDRGLPDVLADYLQAIRPKKVVDLLSLEYRDAVIGYAAGLTGIDVKTVDFPGMGRASQPRRGEKVAEILRSGTG